jgi:hypothetical protein
MVNHSARHERDIRTRRQKVYDRAEVGSTGEQKIVIAVEEEWRFDLSS